MSYRTIIRLTLLLGLILAAGISFSIGFPGAPTVAAVCLGILAIALIGMLRDRREPSSIVVARYSRRGSTRR